ncbi:MAG: hypothetical protein WBE20_04665 [Candidatus Acidiferrales bacterium]
MRRMGVVLGLTLMAAMAARAQIGKIVGVAAGTPEDAAISEINATQDPAKKLALLDKFAADHASGNYALLTDQLYVSVYTDEKNYDKAFEYGDKALAIDPDNFSTGVDLVRAGDQAADAMKLAHYAEAVAAMIARYKTSPAPAGRTAEDWEKLQATTLQSVQTDLQYVEYAFYNSARKAPDPAARGALLERCVAAFPDSSYAKSAEMEVVFAYQAAEDNQKMLDAAQKILKDDPNNVTVLVSLADYWSDRNQRLVEAEADAKKALAALPTEAKPEGVADDQWQKQTSLQKGLALSALGAVYANEDKNALALQEFQHADSLLESDNFSYGRNLYRWGFTLAKMQRTIEARRTLTRAVKTNSPYSRVAAQTLDKIGGPLGPPSQ